MPDETIAQTAFWLGVAIPAYAYLGYPVVLLLLRAVVRRRVDKRPCEPFVSLVVPAYNEGAVIARKVMNSLAIDYPAARYEVLVASDGSRDDTAVVARRFADGARVRVLDYPENRGKTATLNAAVVEARGEIVVFTDADGMLRPDAVRKLVANFADPQVGAVGGKIRLVEPDGVGIGRSEDVYWRYETFLKACESEVASTLGAHGNLYAIRRSLYPFPPAGTINDDYVVPVSVLARRYRAVYEPEALAYEEARELAGFRRRVRIMAGNVQQLREIRHVLRPLRPLPLFFFLSHKATRVAVPVGLLAALVANAALLHDPLYRALSLVQGGFYALALLGAARQRRPGLLLLPFFFCMVNVAGLVGLYHALASRRALAWK